jgi:hypothetical protein
MDELLIVLGLRLKESDEPIGDVVAWKICDIIMIFIDV